MRLTMRSSEWHIPALLSMRGGSVLTYSVLQHPAFCTTEHVCHNRSTPDYLFLTLLFILFREFLRSLLINRGTKPLIFRWYCTPKSIAVRSPVFTVFATMPATFSSVHVPPVVVRTKLAGKAKIRWSLSQSRAKACR